MKTTIEVPDRLLHRAKLVAAKRGTTLKRLFISALEIVASEQGDGRPYAIPDEASDLLEVNEHGMPVLKRRGRRKPVANATVDKLRDELGI